MLDMDPLIGEDIAIIGQHVIQMHNNSFQVNNLNQCRHVLYTRKRRAIEGIPPTQNSLTLHIKQAMLQSG